MGDMVKKPNIEPVLYRNRRTKKEVLRKKQMGTLVQVEYVVSGKIHWFELEDFVRLYKKA